MDKVDSLPNWKFKFSSKTWTYFVVWGIWYGFWTAICEVNKQNDKPKIRKHFDFQTSLVVYTSLNEVLRLGKRVCGVYDRQTINLCWFIIAVLEYYLVGPACLRVLLPSLENPDKPVNRDKTGFVETVLKFLVRQHEALVFFVYLGCLVFFVLTMTRTNYLKR